MQKRRGIGPPSLCATLALGVLLAACGRQLEPMPPVALQVDGHGLTAEVAATEQEQERGLKGRTALADDAGMLFVMAKPADVCMWMKDTPIALSVAFLDTEGRILNIEDMEPNSEAQHCSAKPAAYALEVRRGWFADRQITAGKQAFGLPRARG